MYKASMYNNLIDFRGIDSSRLYYNSASGAIAWIDEKNHEAMINDDIMKINKPHLEQLVRHGFVVNKAIDEYENYMFRSKQFILNKNHDVASFIIALTMQCNLRCKYCFEEGKYGRIKADKELLDNIYLFITSFVLNNKKKKLHITWFGGEPMLAYDSIVALSKRLIDFCNNNNVKYHSSMASNGILFNDENIKELKEVCMLNHVQISMDGEKEYYKSLKHASDNDYNTVYNNLINIVRADIGLSIRLNVCDKNIESVLRLTEQLTSIEDFHAIIYLGKIIKYNNSDIFEEISDDNLLLLEEKISGMISDYDEYKYMLSKQLKPKGASCGYMVHDRCLIGNDGYLYRCEHQINDKRFAIGDLKNGFYHNKVDNQMIFNELPEKCKKCSVMPICMGGCVSDRLYHEKFISCNYFKNRVKFLCKQLSIYGDRKIKEVDYGGCD